MQHSKHPRLRSSHHAAGAGHHNVLRRNQMYQSGVMKLLAPLIGIDRFIPDSHSSGRRRDFGRSAQVRVSSRRGR